MSLALVKLRKEGQSLISIIVFTHGPLSGALVESSKIILGEFDNVTTFSLYSGDNISQISEDVEQAISEKASNSNVLLLTDIPGGSPTNISAAVLQNADFECLTGVNLAMLLEAILLKGTVSDFKEYVSQVEEAGKNGILDLKKLIEAT